MFKLSTSIKTFPALPIESFLTFVEMREKLLKDQLGVVIRISPAFPTPSPWI
jgi:hypothetical protein